ncbi:hypothetical protein [Streptomyces sp. CAI-68]|uniref:hypothetical protein n=1 Tax=Streptomyces sp. CAI-68 TaxID=1169745 RepID=UPI001C31D417|nr:hypothetical protein [Streptomyces sp. CAI-68]
MSPVVGRIYFDTCTLSNFAVVDHLPLLERSYGHRAAWTETIHWEVEKGLRAAPKLAAVLAARWLGDPVEISSSVKAVTEINNIRRALGGVNASPAEHLGEAEVIYHIENFEQNAIFATDDRFALDLARRRGVRCLESVDILAECYAMAEVRCPEAYELLCRMGDADRGVRIPAHHSEVC